MHIPEPVVRVSFLWRKLAYLVTVAASLVKALALAILCTRGRRPLSSRRCSHLRGRRLGAAERRGLDGAARVERLLHGHALVHSAQRVPSLEPGQLCRRVLVQELVHREETAAHLDLDLVLLHADAHLLLPKLVHALRLAHEHDLQLLAVRVVVDILGQLVVDGGAFDGDVDGNACLQINDVLLQRLALILFIAKTSEQLKGGLVGLIALVLKTGNICGC